MSSCALNSDLAKAATPTTTNPVTQPEWQRPVPIVPPPQLKVWNSLTRTKTPFIPTKANTLTWYNCGPTVYDASHMGHARNYVTQDIIRRILRDYLGYDVNFVMNITDIDDKIILRARQSHLVKVFRSQHPNLSKQLLDVVQQAWNAFFEKNLKPFAPPSPPNQPDRPDADSATDQEAGWEEVSRLSKDQGWLTEVTAKQPKFPMWFSALERSRQAQVSAAMSLAAADDSQAAATSLIDASEDVLSSHLDKLLGHTVTDPAIFRDLAAHWENEFFKDMNRLHVERPTTLTRVSEYVPEIVAFVQRIVDNGYAYAEGENEGKRNVWFDTRAFEGGKPNHDRGNAEWSHTYAKLQPWAKGNRELLEEGEGSLSTSAAATVGKRAASDFALWKSSKQGEPAWDSPWGPGRPGWHIECSVMASEVIGENMDIHSGGVDLMFPHHDNEIAQSEAHHDCRQWVNYFLHTGHLHIEGLKMSKSLKNFISIDEALEKFTPRQLRLSFLLQTWSSKMDFKASALGEVKNAEASFNNFFASTKARLLESRSRGEAYSDGKHHFDEAEKKLIETLTEAQMAFREAMCDSFDTPRGIEVLLQLVSKANVYEKSKKKQQLEGESTVNVGVLVAVARYVGDMLRMLGLGEGSFKDGDLGWGDSVVNDSQGGVGGHPDREETLMPYLRVLSNFRDGVRALARKGASPAEILKLADNLRDQDLVDLGVALEDQEGESHLPVVLVPPCPDTS
ncbi:putative cysteinyl-tRNA synthetase [Violaceomyces palustris]|uniref:Cysteinyl-tRNA synthetase n=1 Tax=Violaceomyces palustris TaxID=1673888 RepID=A0ACD0NLC2_9BASI|nr:putative cysteinyl-tRNA synthetase [Violaceomyces palustris]